MLYAESPPTAELADTVACYWHFAITPGLKEPFWHTVPPDGCCSLIFTYPPGGVSPEAELMGVSTRLLQVQVQPGTVFWGIRFKPGALRCYFDLEAEAIRNRVMPLASQPDWTDWVKLAPGQPSFDQWLLPRQRAKPDPLVRQIVTSLNQVNPNRVGEVLAEIPLSERQVQRRFQRAVGVSPKMFARLRRARLALEQLVVEKQTTLDVVHRLGYYDQAHLIRDFADMAGQTPAEMRGYLQCITHHHLEW